MSSAERGHAGFQSADSIGSMSPDDGLRVVIHEALLDHVHSVASGFSVEETNVRRRFREVCVEARRRQIQVEHLVIAIKEAWWSLTRAHEVAGGSMGRELQRQVVTVAIDEYYHAEGG